MEYLLYFRSLGGYLSLAFEPHPKYIFLLRRDEMDAKKNNLQLTQRISETVLEWIIEDGSEPGRMCTHILCEYKDIEVHFLFCELFTLKQEKANQS